MTRLILWVAAAVPVAAAESGAHQRIRDLLSQKKYTEALTAAQALNKHVPDDVTAYELLAQAHLALGHRDEAGKAAQWMLDLQLGRVSPSGSRVIAAIRKDAGDISGAIEILASGYRRLSPGERSFRAAMLVEMADLYRLDNKPDSTRVLLEEARKLGLD